MDKGGGIGRMGIRAFACGYECPCEECKYIRYYIYI